MEAVFVLIQGIDKEKGGRHAGISHSSPHWTNQWNWRLCTIWWEYVCTKWCPMVTKQALVCFHDQNMEHVCWAIHELSKGVLRRNQSRNTLFAFSAPLQILCKFQEQEMVVEHVEWHSAQRSDAAYSESKPSLRVLGYMNKLYRKRSKPRYFFTKLIILNEALNFMCIYSWVCEFALLHVHFQ